MPIWASITNLFRPTPKQDPVFGPLRYQRTGFWEARTYFAPESKACDVTIDGGEDRPTASQRRFYKEVEQRYPALQDRIAKELLSLLRNWNEAFEESDVWQQFTLEGFSLPDLDAGQEAWEIVYEHEEDGHFFCVLMTQWEIEGIRIDG